MWQWNGQPPGRSASHETSAVCPTRIRWVAFCRRSPGHEGSARWMSPTAIPLSSIILRADGEGGIEAPGFFKHELSGKPDWVPTLRVKHLNRTIDHLIRAGRLWGAAEAEVERVPAFGFPARSRPCADAAKPAPSPPSS